MRQTFYYFLFCVLNITILATSSFCQVDEVEILIGDSTQVVKEHTPPFSPTEVIISESFTIPDPVDAGIDSIRVNEEGSALLAYIKLRLDSTAEAGETYRKVVTLIYRAGQSSSAFQHDFRVLAKGQLTIPTIPMLVQPANGTTGTPLTVNLSWMDIQDAETYHIQVSKEEDFSSLTAEDDNLTGTSFDLSAPDFQTTYYWRVRSMNAAGNSEWSETWSFTTAVSTSLETLGLISSWKNYPNPVKATTFVNFTSATSFPAELTLYNAVGTLVKSVRKTVVSGENFWQLDLQLLPPGSYILRVTGKEGSLSRKLILSR